MCFTGRMTRLVNALQGIVEGVHVGVSGREQLQARVAVVMAHPDAPGSRDQLLAALDDAAAVLASGEREAWLSAFDDARLFCAKDKQGWKHGNLSGVAAE